MSYQNYVIAAYMVFAVVLLWDWIAPRIELKQQLRVVKLRAARAAGGRSNDTTPTAPLARDERQDP